MATGNTTIASGAAIAAQRWWDQLFVEYLDQLVLSGYMGTDKNSLIFVQEDLAKQKGETINMPLLAGLDAAGVEGESTLEGQEEQLNIYNQAVTLTEYSHAVRDNGALTRQRSAFDLFAQFKPELTTWLAQKTEALCFAAWQDIAGVAYGSATENQKDTWLAANSDRVLFGATTANIAANDHSAALLNVDTTSDQLTPSVISLAKRMAQLADPKIRPIRVDGGMEFYIMFVHPYAVRDLKASTAWLQAQQYGMPRGMDNPLFTGAIGQWDGVLLVESCKVPVLSGVGAATCNVACNFLCGAQSLVYAQGAYEGGVRIKMFEKDFDYGRQKGVAIMSMFKIAKAYFNSKDHGVVRVYTSAASD